MNDRATVPAPSPQDPLPPYTRSFLGVLIQFGALISAGFHVYMLFGGTYDDPGSGEPRYAVAMSWVACCLLLWAAGFSMTRGLSRARLWMSLSLLAFVLALVVRGALLPKAYTRSSMPTPALDWATIVATRIAYPLADAGWCFALCALWFTPRFRRVFAPSSRENPPSGFEAVALCMAVFGVSGVLSSVTALRTSQLDFWQWMIADAILLVSSIWQSYVGCRAWLTRDAVFFGNHARRYAVASLILSVSALAARWLAMPSDLNSFQRFILVVSTSGSAFLVIAWPLTLWVFASGYVTHDKRGEAALMARDPRRGESAVGWLALVYGLLIVFGLLSCVVRFHNDNIYWSLFHPFVPTVCAPNYHSIEDQLHRTLDRSFPLGYRLIQAAFGVFHFWIARQILLDTPRRRAALIAFGVVGLAVTIVTFFDPWWGGNLYSRNDATTLSQVFGSRAGAYVFGRAQWSFFALASWVFLWTDTRARTVPSNEAST